MKKTHHVRGKTLICLEPGGRTCFSYPWFIDLGRHSLLLSPLPLRDQERRGGRREVPSPQGRKDIVRPPAAALMSYHKRHDPPRELRPLGLTARLVADVRLSPTAATSGWSERQCATFQSHTSSRGLWAGLYWYFLLTLPIFSLSH